MRPSTPLLILPILSLSSTAYAWGTTGHQTIVYIATSYLLPSTLNLTQTLLSSQSPSYLANQALWADTFRYTPEGAFSSPFHYIDAEDDPPSACNVDLSRDCAEEGCIVSALANYTSILGNEGKSQEARAQALKFVIHFVGDAHQPLHNEALAVGGNEIDVLLDGKGWNLHALWDTGILGKLRGVNASLADSESFAGELRRDIEEGVYEEEKGEWLEGLDVGDPEGTALEWAKGANELVCEVVVPEGVDAVEGKELGGEYYENALPVVKRQLAKAGYRLAAWLNLIATGKTGCE